MKKILALTLLLGVTNLTATDESFNVTMTLFAGITITETQALLFPSQQALTVGTYTVLTGDAGAATFTATGNPSANFTRSVVEASINMTNGGSTIPVNAFTVAGPTAFDVSGNAVGLKVGATATVDATDIAGSYTGAATYRIIY